MWSQPLVEALESGEAVVAGVLSGTSADGIDVALARFAPGLRAGRPRAGQPAFELLAFETLPFAPQVLARLRPLLDGASATLADLALLNRDLGRAFGGAVAQVANSAGVRPDLVGSHGQTVWHHDGALASGAATLQLGDGDHVAEEAGCAVVSDFRQADVAAGGEGAPLSPLADDWLFPSPRPCAVLNLGGMANLTLLAADGVLAFDTGPAGSLLDGLARRLLGERFDGGGAVAASGRAHDVLVEQILEHPFFQRSPPKSTGRDTFGEGWVDDFLAAGRELGVDSPPDLLASAVEIVARPVAQGLASHAPEVPVTFYIAGGGVHNRALMAALERLLPLRPELSDAAGVPADGREALVFAVLAARCVLGVGVSRAGATGARSGRLLGKISPGPGPG